MAPHSRSKRIEARKKYKVAKKVNQHHKKLRRAAKNDERKGRKEKDPGMFVRRCCFGGLLGVGEENVFVR